MPGTLDRPFYYLDNFRHVLGWIGQRYADLLIDEEHEFLAQFALLPQAAQAMLVRLVMRKGNLFRASKLRYAEIGPASDALQPLIALGWVEPDPFLSAAQLAGLMTKGEVERHFFNAPDKRPDSKAQQLAQLQSIHAESRRVSEWNVLAGEAVYQVHVAARCDRFRLMYFGNLHQDWTEFVLSHLGVYRYENVAFSASSRAFQSRRDIDDYLQIHAWRERFQQAQPIADIAREIPPDRHANPWLQERRAKLLFDMAQRCERLGDDVQALALYRRSEYAGARIRTIRVLEKAGRIPEAMTHAIEAEGQPENEAERHALTRILPRLRRKLGYPPAGMQRPAVPDAMTLTLPASDAPASVEQHVRLHLHRADAPVFYVENTLFNALFGLLCWDAIYAAIPGAFFHPFHHGPADLRSAGFYVRRKALFDACMAQLGSSAYIETIQRRFLEKAGIQSPFVAWGALTEDLLAHALHCIPAIHLKKCFERLLADLPENRSGFPDLIQFQPQERQYRMIEVKGPGDRLQDNQIRWLEYFAAHRIPAAVCHVRWDSPC